MQRTLSDVQARYLQGLVRMHIRKITRTISRFAPKPGQSDEEAAVVLKGFGERLEFAAGTYRALGGDPDRITPRGGKP